jgi:hypothetical protein
MTMSSTPRRRTRLRRLTGAGLAALALASCGGGGNPLGNPPLVDNPGATGGQKLSFAYFQRCIYPIFQAPLQINISGAVSINTCAASGCHDNSNGTGGAFRVVQGAQAVPLTGTPDAIRATDMYRNFYSAFGATVIGSPGQSRLLNKPLVDGVLHGGGLIFANAQDPNARLMQYWITRPWPDEFSSAANGMFAGNDPQNGACNTL